MIKGVVKFWGTGQDEYGMPIPFYSYLVVSSPWHTASGAVASVVPLSEEALATARHFPVLTGGERAAFDLAVDALKQLPLNAGLSFRVDED